MVGLLGAMLGFAIIIFIFAIAMYIVEGIFLTKLNKVMYGKGTALAWIPVANSYLLGKLTINDIVGWCLLGGQLLTMTFSTTLNGVKKTFSILPDSIRGTLSTVLSAVQLGLLVYAIIKYFKLKKEVSTINLNNEQNVNSVSANNISQVDNAINNELNQQYGLEMNANVEGVSLVPPVMVDNMDTSNISSNEPASISTNSKVILEDVPVMPELGGSGNVAEEVVNAQVTQIVNPNDVPVIEDEVSAFNQQPIEIKNDVYNVSQEIPVESEPISAFNQQPIQIEPVEIKESTIVETLDIENNSVPVQPEIEQLPIETMNVDVTDIKNN